MPHGGMANPCRRKLSERPVRREKLIKLKKGNDNTMIKPNQRQQNQLHALRQALGLPPYRPVNDAIAFSLGAPMDVAYSIELAHFAAERQKDCIHMAFAHAGAKRASNFSVVFREIGNVDIIRSCVPYAESDDAPVRLVSTSGQGQFMVDARGSLQRIAGLPDALGAGHKRALRRIRQIAARMGDAGVPGSMAMDTDAALLAESGPREPVICIR
ncbi:MULTISPECIES: hypothetical protein [Pseudomonadota]|uniref:hypothetical protein n=1 Tax=Pseudomonadota TaxID=1224 RepID=UPI000B096002|nr:MULTISPECIES: hypothetical protein [Pseudomonadota]MCH2239831.1 hypothetical protein [Blastomonas sp.]